MEPKDLREFQQYIWDNLPERKHRLGRELIYDCVSVAVQEWPDDILAHTHSGDTGELIATKELIRTIRRHLALTYGDDRFHSLWLLALQIMLPILVDQILRWWRRNNNNRKRLRIWRRGWVNGQES
jgi:hypothetical protein